MKLGTIYSSPWGEYVVWKLEPLIMRSGINACVVDPTAEFLAGLTPTGRTAVVGTSGLPVAVSPENETETGPSPCTADGGGAPSESTAPSHEHARTLGAFRSALSMSWVPGAEAPVWVPCKTRSDVPEHALKTHVYFLGELSGSIYCPECRALQPRMLYLRDGVVVRDSHHDVPASAAIGFRIAEAPGAESPTPDLSSEALLPLCASETDGESASSELSATARENRDAAIEQVDGAATEQWKARALQAVGRAAVRQELLIVDDMWTEFRAADEDFADTGTHELRAMGAVVLQACQRGWLARTDMYRASERPNCHANPRRVWRSLIVGHDIPELRGPAPATADATSSALVAMAVAREDGAPRTPSDAKAASLYPPGEVAPPLYPADDPKETVGDFAPPPLCKICGERPCRCKFKTPIGRPWLGLWEWKEWCAERAAIIEYDGNIARHLAEKLARSMAGAAPR